MTNLEGVDTHLPPQMMQAMEKDKEQEEKDRQELETREQLERQALLAQAEGAEGDAKKLALLALFIWFNCS